MSSETLLPDSWTVASLSDLLLTLETGSRPKGGVKGIIQGVPSLGGEHLDSEGGFRFKNIRYVPESFAHNMARGHLRIGDVLVVKDGATTGKTSFVGKNFPYPDAVVNEHLFLCRVEPYVNSKYVFFYLLSERGNSQILEDFRGAAQGGISQRFADLVKVPVAPKTEQTRIVDKLDELLSDLDAGVEELKVAQKKLAQYRQSLLKAAVEGALTSEWRSQNKLIETGAQLLQRILTERRTRWEAKQLAKFADQDKPPTKDWQKKYPEPIQPDTSDLSELPVGWVWASLDQLVAESSYGTSVKCDYESEGMPVLRIPNVSGGKLDLRDMKFSTTNLDLNKNDYLTVGDVLVIRTNGSIGLVGRAAAVVADLPTPHYFASYLLRLRCTETTSVHRWILALLSSHTGRHWLEARAASSAGQYNISLSTLLTMPIPLPPIEEQICALDYVEGGQESIKQQEEAMELSIKQSNAQRKNILKAAFSGQLVPQDPNDEPASVLLEHIRAERAERAERDKQPKVRKTKQQKEITAVVSKLIDVLAEVGDWVSAQEAFRRCGVADGAETEQIEVLYAELRDLDKAGRLAVEPVTDAQGRKLHDRLKLLKE